MNSNCITFEYPLGQRRLGFSKSSSDPNRSCWTPEPGVFVGIIRCFYCFEKSTGNRYRGLIPALWTAHALLQTVLNLCQPDPGLIGNFPVGLFLGMRQILHQNICIARLKARPAALADFRLTLPLPKVINLRFFLQPHQKYYITQYEERGCSSLTLVILPILSLPQLCTSLDNAGRMYVLNLGVIGFSGRMRNGRLTNPD